MPLSEVEEDFPILLADFCGEDIVLGSAMEWVLFVWVKGEIVLSVNHPCLMDSAPELNCCSAVVDGVVVFAEWDAEDLVPFRGFESLFHEFEDVIEG